MMVSTWWLPFVWLLNGVLAVLYLTVEHGYLVILGLALVALGASAQAPLEQKPWFAGAAALAFAVALFSPPVVGVLMAAMALAALAALRLERFNPPLLFWRVTQGLALYALIALGVLAYRTLIASMPADWTLGGGQQYLEVIASIALYAYPLGFLAMLAQAVFAHPPIGAPEDLITTVRTRGKR